MASYKPSPSLFFVLYVFAVGFLVDATDPPTSAEQQYTLRLPATAKYYPKDVEELFRQIQHEQHSVLKNDASRGPGKPVMKLLAHVNEDEGEKYYDFDAVAAFSTYRGAHVHSVPGRLYLPVNPHHSQLGREDDKGKNGWTDWIKPARGLQKRQQTEASCPSGNSACTNIQKPGYCCPAGSSCVNIKDTGFGSVGCCPDGQPCGDSLSSCSPGYTRCPQGSGGGCCLPGYICSPEGCLVNTSGVTAPSTVTQLFTTTVGLDICQAGFYPCPASFNYGCCQVGYLCALHACPYNTGPGTPGTEYTPPPIFTLGTTVVIENPSTTATFTYPSGFSTIDTATIRPATAGGTTNTEDAPKITDAPGNIINPNGGCPNGWLTCGIEFGGGCCRVGRSCGRSYCPLALNTDDGGMSVTTVTTNGVCPAGWLACPADVQGGCCPSGYGCGVYNCPPTSVQNGEVVFVTTAAAAQKLSPVSRGAGVRVRGEVWGVGAIGGWCLGYIVLMILF